MTNNLNLQQKEAITTINGPVLIIAGPGTGKTFTLVERVKHMVIDKNINPSEIMISTFTNKAAFELIDRLSMQFTEKGVSKDVNDMLVNNFHGICRTINDRYLHLTNLKKGYTQIDDISQNYLVRRYLNAFRKIENFDNLISLSNPVKDIVSLVNKLREEAILERQSSDPVVNVGLQILDLYEKILTKYNMIDFSGILFTTFKLLKDYPEVKDELNSEINYIMIDEYQDTNKIQEQIIFLLLNKNNNLCVVGDDDQSLYRFRGATVRNILEFDDKFENVKVIKLRQNYRSEDSIIKFYSKYLTDLTDEHPELKKYRHNKLLFSDRISENNRVVRLMGKNEDDWLDKTRTAIEKLVQTGAINSYNEVAVLFSSINSSQARKFISHMKSHGIDVYLPKTSTLLSKNEVLEMIAALQSIFDKEIKNYVANPDNDTRAYLDVLKSRFDIKINRDKELSDFINRMQDYINSESFQISLNDIIYRLFAYNPFYKYMKDQNKAKNLSRFLELLESFSLINRIFYINKTNIKDFVNLFFYDFISFIKDQKISEFEEETKIPDENSISVLTIHASKGMEYPVVIMGSLWDKVYGYRKIKPSADRLIDRINESKGKDSGFEPYEMINKLDFYRKYYTGFSRAKDLLILSGYDMDNYVSKDLKDIVNSVEDFDIAKLNMEKGQVKDSKVKKPYSYTGHIVPYLKSPYEYLYNVKLRFKQEKTKALFYGSIVHESIEYINKSLIKNEKFDESIYDLVREIAIQKYNNGAIMLTSEDIEKAKIEVENYLANIQEIGKPIYTELEINYSKDDYVLRGSVDLVTEKDGKYHVVDIKTGKSPEQHEDKEVVKSYLYQINLYAYLLKKTKNMDIETISLYFTNPDAEKNLYTYQINADVNRKIMITIEKVIKDIENEKFEFSDSYKANDGLLKFFLDRLYAEETS